MLRCWPRYCLLVDFRQKCLSTSRKDSICFRTCSFSTVASRNALPSCLFISGAALGFCDCCKHHGFTYIQGMFKESFAAWHFLIFTRERQGSFPALSSNFVMAFSGWDFREMSIVQKPLFSHSEWQQFGISFGICRYTLGGPRVLWLLLHL